MMLQDPDVRIPGARRDQLEEHARAEGIDVGSGLLEQLRTLAGGEEKRE
jgi:LDH2 family malate/lactate/ureidoglycolate dehydrogenase